MADRACCDNIIEAQSKIDELLDWRDKFLISSQQWRDSHTADNRKDRQEMKEQLDRIESKLTTFVNPVLAVVISGLTTIIGLLAGALWVLLR